MTYTDADALRRELAMMGQLFMLGQTDVSCVLSLVCADGRTITSHQQTEADCLADIHRQAKETLL